MIENTSTANLVRCDFHSCRAQIQFALRTEVPASWASVYMYGPGDCAVSMHACPAHADVLRGFFRGLTGGEDELRRILNEEVAKHG